MASNPQSQSSIISRPGGEDGDGGMLYTNAGSFEEEERDEQVGGDRVGEDTVGPPEAVDVIPKNWKDAKGAPTAACKPKGGDFSAFHSQLKLYKPDPSRANHWQICCWVSPFFDHKKHAYCEISQEWRNGNSGALTNHLNTVSHKHVLAQYEAAKVKGLKGHLQKRAALTGEKGEPLWSWVVDEDSTASSSASVASSVTFESSGRTESSLPPGNQQYFMKDPIKGEEGKQRHTNYLCGIIARDARPISFAHRDGFVDYLTCIHPNLKPPHFKTLMETMKAMQLKRQKQIGEGLRKTRTQVVKRIVSLPPTLNLSFLPDKVKEQHNKMRLAVPYQFNSWSSDSWKRNNSASKFLAVVSHTITHDFCLSEKLLMFREFDHRCFSVNIAKAFDTCMVEVGVENYREGMEEVEGDGMEKEKEDEQVEEEEKEEVGEGPLKHFFQAAVLDGAADGQKATRICENKPARVHKCSIHTLQRVIIQSVKQTKVQEMAAGGTSYKTIMPVKRLLRKANALVKLCKHGSRANKALAKACVSEKIKSLQLVRANATRWSSLYRCVESIKRAEKAIKHMFAYDQTRDEKERVFSPKQLEKIVFTAVEWTFMGELLEILEPFTAVTTDLQGQSYETASLALPLLLICSNSIKANRHSRMVNNVVTTVKEKDLSVTAVAFRKQLRREMKERFPFSGAKMNMEEKRSMLEQFYVPTFFNPSYDLRSAQPKLEGASDNMIKLAKNIVKEGMEELLQPLLQVLEQYYTQWKETNSKRKRQESSSSNAASKKSRDNSGLASGRFMHFVTGETGQGDNDEEENGEDEGDVGPALPKEIINTIIENELKAYATKPIPKGEVFNNLNWWKRLQDPSEDMPIPGLSALASKYLCVPASSSKCEQIFSQGGIIDTKLRNRMKQLTLEILVYLKNNWDRSLYNMSHKEKMKILEEWAALAKGKGLDDPTDRDYGIEGDRLTELDDREMDDVENVIIDRDDEEEVGDDDDAITIWSTEDELNFDNKESDSDDSDKE